jgi:succinate dehydrogenase / fumarate reductase cytochrome b subunit
LLGGGRRAAARGPEAYAGVQAVSAAWYGKLVLFGYSWALFHHMFGGLRHFIWDTGRGFELRTVEILARISTFVPPVLTMFVWVMAYYYMGAWS